MGISGVGAEVLGLLLQQHRHCKSRWDRSAFSPELMSSSLTGVWAVTQMEKFRVLPCHGAFPWLVVATHSSWVCTSPPQLSLMMGSRVSQLRTDSHSQAGVEKVAGQHLPGDLGLAWTSTESRIPELACSGKGTERLQKVGASKNTSGRTGRESLQLLLHHAASSII